MKSVTKEIFLKEEDNQQQQQKTTASQNEFIKSSYVFTYQYLSFEDFSTSLSTRRMDFIFNFDKQRWQLILLEGYIDTAVRRFQYRNLDPCSCEG